MTLSIRSLFFCLTSIFTLFTLMGENDIVAETLPISVGSKVPLTYDEMWQGFDPRKEPLEIEVLHRWEKDGGGTTSTALPHWNL